MIAKLFRKYREQIMYLIFGVATTAVNWVVYVAMQKVFRAEMTLCNAVAWVIAVAFAYVTNKLFVFDSKSWKASVVFREAVAFVGARVFTGLLEIAVPTLLFRIGLDQAAFGIEGFAAKAVTSVAVIVLNYVFSKLIVFRGAGKGDGAQVDKHCVNLEEKEEGKANHTSGQV